jgi:hypothetical protein
MSERIKSAILFFILVFRRAFIHLLPLVILSLFTEQWLAEAIQDTLSRQSPSNLAIVTLGAVSILHSMIFPLLGTLVVVACIQGLAPHRVLLRCFQQLFKEEMRVWGKSMLWSYLLLVPGFIKYLQYSFVPFVVMMDTEYEQGLVDALATSKRRSRGLLGKLFLLFIIFSVAWPLLSSSVDEYKIFLKSPVTAFGFAVVDMTLLVIFVLCVYALYRKSDRHSV